MRVVLFDGTTEGRTLSRELAALGAEATVCVATGYGQEAQGEFANVTVRTGRLEADGMVELLRSADLCVDTTHPYAVQASAFGRGIMFTLVIGGAASGKSGYAEDLILRAGPLLRTYIATMEPFDGECRACKTPCLACPKEL